jgi:hypothetical protein
MHHINLSNIIKGLIIHYLHQGTVEEAIKQGRTGGVPDELLDSLPGIMFEVTSAAGAVFGGERNFDEVVDDVTSRAFASGNVEDFSREDASAFIKMAIDFLTELSTEMGLYSSLPEKAEPWYEYGRAQRPNIRSRNK